MDCSNEQSREVEVFDEEKKNYKKGKYLSCGNLYFFCWIFIQYVGLHISWIMH